jgi:hypothetical protein
MKISITNVSNKKILGVSFAHDFWQDHYCQIDENEDMMEIKQHSPINIGDIQPKHHRVVHLWSSIDLSDNFFKDVKKGDKDFSR